MIPTPPSRAFLRFTAVPIWVLVLALVLGSILPVASAQALVRFDFEMKYLVHPGVQTWDFCLVRAADDTFHVFYTAVREGQSNATNADTLWHAASPDLIHWDIVGPALIIGQGFWDAGALWAPDVVRDEEQGDWVMAYTGVDANMNQRICIARSTDLYYWDKYEQNPTIEPDTNIYNWDPDGYWSDFRDPFLYRQDDQWHVHVTAQQKLNGGTGAIYHGVSSDLKNWTDVGPIFLNDGDEPWRVLESSQYHVRGEYHHLLFGEFDNLGIHHIASRDTNSFSMEFADIIDYGLAPEWDEFDEGHNLFSRLANYNNPLTGYMSYTVRFDSLRVNADGSEIEIYKPHPLDEVWASRAGVANLANPTFGDNSAFRGDDPVGLVGNGFYGSQEYFQGPLSGRGSPGTRLGDGATGDLISHVFTIAGDQIDLLVGGGYYPETCYVALMDADADTVLFSETGEGQELMSPRTWDLRPYFGREVYLHIADHENGAMGHINVDEIIESYNGLAEVADLTPQRGLTDLGPAPNPFNPATAIRFELAGAAQVQVQVHDLRGRLVWDGGVVAGRTGLNEVSWQGVDAAGRSVPAGTYLYSITLEGAPAARGKLSLVK